MADTHNTTRKGLTMDDAEKMMRAIAAKAKATFARNIDFGELLSDVAMGVLYADIHYKSSKGIPIDAYRCMCGRWNMLSEHKRRRKNESREEFVYDIDDFGASCAQTPESLTQKKELVDKALRIIDGLDEPYRTTMREIYVENKTRTEVYTKHGVSKATISRRERYALKVLRWRMSLP